jgi:glutathione S-transferase
MSDLILYSNKMSRGRIVHWMLEELGVPYDVEWVDFGPRMKVISYTSINPMGKVPALKHGNGIVTETAAILTYLADTFADKGLIPAIGTPARAAFYRWIFFVAGPLEAATTNAFLKLEAPELTPLGTPVKGFLGYGSLDLTLNTLENHLNTNPYLCGEQFTAADIYLASHLAFGIGYTKAYPQRDTFKAYLERLNQRPAKLRAEAL